MAVCSTTAPRKYLTQHSNLGQPLREKASSTTGGHAKGETIRNSGRYRRPLFKSSEGLWRDLKRHHLAHQTFAGPDNLDQAIHDAVRKLNTERSRHPLANHRTAA